MPCHDCLNRRDFIAKTALGAAAVAATNALTGCGDGQIGPEAISGPAGQKQITVASFADLAVTGKLVAVDADRVVKRTGPTTFAAFSRVCTHEGCPVDVVGAGASFRCPCHLSAFDNNGHVTQGPATRNLPTLTTSYNAATDVLTIG